NTLGSSVLSLKLNGNGTGGKVGINTTTPNAILDVRGAGGAGTPANSGTIPVASISGKSSFAGLVVDNSGVGDILAASSSGLTRFVIKQSGVVQIGDNTNGL